MIIRKYQKEDAAAVDEIFDRCHRGTFGRPNLSHIVSAAIIEEDKKILGFGALEVILEAVMIIDTDLPISKRLEILRQLLDAAQFITKKNEFERFYMFPSDENFKEILMNKYGMNPCSSILSCEVSVLSHDESVNKDEVKENGK